METSEFKAYVNRMKGQRFDTSAFNDSPPSRLAVLLSTFVASFIGMAIVSSLTYNAQWFVERNVPVMAGSFGASAVLIYGAIEAPLSQPRNVIHPPASATALIAVSGGQVIYDLGYWYVLCPIALGIALMMVVAMLVNNVARRYPTHWWNPKKKRITVVDQDMSTTIADFVSSDDDATNDSATPRTHQVDVSSRSSMTASPSAHDLPSHSPHHHSPHHNSQPKFGVYYGGEQHGELKDHERMFEERTKANAHSDLEHGKGHIRPSIVIEKRGLAHAETSEDEFRATIERLQHRIHELESQLASAAEQSKDNFS
ncbi:hypothetical protein BGZ65_011849 [Modicella reniformis]|uniref:HPP transmembrane region domain-containing protein n=1 Tax=Modicella reniformis TaxID=1440133 RepID=A0A9P6SQB5_9FUNG|nr:hypothetical protein BGZ65_011849 [Modicella reniformis]